VTTLTDDPVSPEDCTHLGLLGEAYALSEAPLKIGELGAYYLHATSLSESKKRNIGNVIQRDLDRDDNLSIQHGHQHTLAHHLRNIQQDAYLKHLAPNTGRQESFERKKISVPVTFELRDYQQDCVGQLEAEHNQENPRHLVLKLPTGAGKTRTSLTFIRNMMDRSPTPLNVIWQVHSKLLCDQAATSFEDVWDTERPINNLRDVWVNRAYNSMLELDAIPDEISAHQFIVVTPDAIRTTRSIDIPIDLIVVDEAHHGIEEQQTLRALLPDVPVLGLTATPELTTYRTRFNEMYKRTVAPSRTLQAPFSGTVQEWLIETGVLSRFDIEEKSIAQEASESIGFDNVNLDKRWSDQGGVCSIISDLAFSMMAYNDVRKLLVFCDAVEQCEVIASLLRSRGLRAMSVAGNYPRKDEIIESFRSKQFEILISVNLLREGYDEPTVDGILMARRKISHPENAPLRTQIIGRGLRGPKSGGTPHCLVWMMTR
jgi:superfamily II DNA or RNA helicase